MEDEKLGGPLGWWRSHMNDRAELGDEWRWWHPIPYAWLFTRDWWRYILAPRAWDTSLWSASVCRWRGHPCGTIFYNPNGYEPDNHCKNCGDNLG
jgi:hypothetical protein